MLIQSHSSYWVCFYSKTETRFLCGFCKSRFYFTLPEKIEAKGKIETTQSCLMKLTFSKLKSTPLPATPLRQTLK